MYFFPFSFFFDFSPLLDYALDGDTLTSVTLWQ
jgi:hypothetical protein